MQHRMRGCLAVATVMTLAVVVAMAGGCSGRPAASRKEPRPTETVRAVPVVPAEVRLQLLDGAVAVLRRLDDFDEAAAYEQVFDRLNQWSHAGPAEVEWQREPLIASLPESLRAPRVVDDLEGSTFDAAVDPIFLRDQRWLADLATSIRGDAVDDLEIARRLFTWTVRALALVTDPPMQPTDGNPGVRWFQPGEILLSGRASAAQRSWMFLELLRHAGLSGVMIATRGASAEAGEKSSSDDQQSDGQQLVPWIPAVISGNEAWLFEPTYGMPIPGPGGKGIATVRQAQADPAILASLDAAGRPYPVRADDLSRLGILVSATPESLSRRMLMVERSLVGSNAMSLAVQPAARVAEARAALSASDGAGIPAALWAFPWQTSQSRRQREADVQAAIGRELAALSVQLPEPAGSGPPRIFRPLFTARVREFRGELDGRDGAKFAYLAARPSESSIRGYLAGMPPQQAEPMRRLVGQMKEDATYFLGVVTLGEGEYAAAIDFLDRMTLEASPDGRWADAARINAAAAYEASGQAARARELLEADESPQRYGSRLQARRLEAAAAASPEPEIPPSKDEEAAS